MSKGSIAQLAGILASHARGQTLSASFGATSCESLPDGGAVFALGTEFQGDSTAAGKWIEWAVKPGRVLVVVPPFGRGPCGTPTLWEARSTETLAGGETELGKILARERRYEIRGRLLPLERNAGQVITAGWRKHPTAGLVVITALPLWSLSVLDHRPACVAWLATLMEQAGQRTQEASSPGETSTSRIVRTPTPDEWTFLLHLCTGLFDSEDAAVKALAHSTVHRLSEERAVAAQRGLVDLGYAKDGALTSEGDQALLGSPYATFSRALRRQHER